MPQTIPNPKAGIVDPYPEHLLLSILHVSRFACRKCFAGAVACLVRLIDLVFNCMFFMQVNASYAAEYLCIYIYIYIYTSLSVSLSLFARFFLFSPLSPQTSGGVGSKLESFKPDRRSSYLPDRPDPGPEAINPKPPDLQRLWDLVSRSITGISRVTVWVVGVINLLTTSPSPSKYHVPSVRSSANPKSEP